MQDMTLRARMLLVNKLMGILADKGSFLYSPAYERRGRFGFDRVDSVWYIDHHSGMKIYPFGQEKWIGWTGTDSQRAIVAMLALFAKEGHGHFNADVLIDATDDGETKMALVEAIDHASTS